ncbi:GtrA family protein [Huaxiibacter chinensis]|uniref:GtrA family protein n=1 Tax=Huaxiibacter chinensis TaxID=2899785 RepID=UPI0012FB1DBE
MCESLVLFIRFIFVGVANTAIHALIFLLFYILFSFPQSMANVIAFIVAATFSFVVNATWTFRKRKSALKYLSFISFMACLAWGTGRTADLVGLPAIFTLLIFSAISMVVGFLLSRYIIFTD